MSHNPEYDNFKGYTRPPAWPGYNSYNLNVLAMHLWENVPDGTRHFDMAVVSITPISHAMHLFGNPHNLGVQDFCGHYLIRRVSFLPRWTWCFSPRWTEVDNSTKGCAQRIFQLVAYGLPLDYADQIVKQAPLSYTHLTPKMVISREESQYEGGQFEFSRVSLEERKAREKS